MGCFVVAEFLLTIASRGPSAIAEPLVEKVLDDGILRHTPTAEKNSSHCSNRPAQLYKFNCNPGKACAIV